MATRCIDLFTDFIFSQFQGSSLPKPSCVCLLPCLIIFLKICKLCKSATLPHFEKNISPPFYQRSDIPTPAFNRNVFFFGGEKKWSLELALIFAGVDALGEVGEDVEGTGLDSWQSQRSSSCPQRTPAPERWGPGIMDWVWGWPPFFNRYIDGNFLSEVH